MRLTINLDDDLHRMAKALAIAEDCSISVAVNKLLRRLNEPHRLKPSGSKAKPGLPVVECKQVVTAAEVDQVEAAETLRHWSV